MVTNLACPICKGSLALGGGIMMVNGDW